MCLIPMGGGGMQMPQIEGTPKARTLRTWCYYCVGVHVILSFVLMFDQDPTGNDVFAGIMELITALFLYCGASQFNFCCVLCYLFLLIFSFVQ